MGLLTSLVIGSTNQLSFYFMKENVAPAVEDSSNGSPSEEATHNGEITEEEIQDIWKNVTLTQ